MVTVSDLASLWVWKQDSHLYSRNHGDNLSEVFTRISVLIVCDNSNLFFALENTRPALLKRSLVIVSSNSASSCLTTFGH